MLSTAPSIQETGSKAHPDRAAWRDTDAIHWQIDTVDLHADAVTLQLGDLTFTPQGADVAVTEDIHAKGHWYLDATWDEDRERFVPIRVDIGDGLDILAVWATNQRSREDRP